MDHLRSGSGGDEPRYGPEPDVFAVRRKDVCLFRRLLYFPFVAYDLLRPQGIQPLDISTDPFYPQVKHYF